MRYLFASVGSLGDALPYLRLAQAMQRRGHAVSMFCNEEHRRMIERTQVHFVSAGDALQYGPTTANPHLWHPRKGLGVLWRGLLAPSIESLFHEIKQFQAAHADLHVVAGPHMMGARLAQIHLGTRLTSIYTAPNMLRTHIAPTTIAHTHWLRPAPRWLLGKVWQWIDARKLEPMARPALLAACQRLGVPQPPPDVSLFGQWVHSTQLGITLYPEWFAPVPADHALPAISGEFPIGAAMESAADALTGLDAPLRGFLQAGPAPVVVMLGSAMAHAHDLYARWQQALGARGLRGILLSPQRQQLPEPAAGMLTLGFAPFENLLPQCKALVHHGGIGSCVQALVAGIPQIIQPHAHDQFENARCAARSGAARTIHREASIGQMQAMLDALDCKPWQQQALGARQRIASSGGLDRLCGLIAQA